MLIYNSVLNGNLTYMYTDYTYVLRTVSWVQSGTRGRSNWFSFVASSHFLPFVSFSFFFSVFFSLRAIYELYLKEKRNRLIWLDLDRTCDLKFPFIREYSLLILYNFLNFEEWRNTQYFVNRLLIVNFIGIKNRSSFDRGMHVIINHNRSRWPLCMKRCRDTYRSRWIIYKYSYGVNESSAILVP